MQRTVELRGLLRIVTLSEPDESAVKEGEAAFLHFQIEGVILNESMQDEVWLLTDQKRCFHVSFFLPSESYIAESWLGCTHTTFLLSLRLFILFRLGVYGLSHIQALAAACLSLGKCTGQKVDLSPNMIPGVVDFLSYLPGESDARDSVMEEMENIPLGRCQHSRALAPFGTYVAFEERLSDFWSYASQEERLALFPVYLWWKLTCILPLRPTEFLLTPADCVHSLDGKYVLTVRRTHLKKGRRVVYYRIDRDYDLFDYVIPEGLAHDIQWYKQATQNSSQPSLDTLLRPSCDGSYFRYGAMRELLRNTLIALDMQPDTIHLGDTRHLSMISLVLSGDTPSVCKALANHESVRISAGYFANMTTLNDCHILRSIYESISPASLVQPHQTDGEIVPSSLRLESGYCTYYTVENFDARECVRYWDPVVGLGQCTACPHYLPDKQEVLLHMKQDTQWQLQLSLQLLMESVEQLRKGQGHEETVDSLLKRVKSKTMLYMAQIRKEQEYVTATETTLCQED